MTSTPFARWPDGLYRAEQVRVMDRRGIVEGGIAGYTLMGRAAAAALAALEAQWPRARCMRVLCGAGNNAGDGYVLARLAAATGRHVRVAWLTDPDRLDGDAARAAADARQAGVPMEAYSEDVLDGAEVVVDALLGIGLTRDLAGVWAAAVDALNRSRAPVLALDVPSGLDADTGAERGIAVRAAATVTFIALKCGLFTGKGPDCRGRLLFAPLEVSSTVVQGIAPAARLYRGADLPEVLAPRARSAHKGRFGHVLVVGGEEGMGGAVRLAGEAALRTGAGLVSVATRPSHVPAILAGCPELMARGVKGADDLRPMLARASVVAAGPGLGTGRWSAALLETVLESGRPLVLDADALNLIAGRSLRRAEWVLTPHPGEAARLLGTGTVEVECDRVGAAVALADRYGGVAVLKGAGTVTCGAPEPGAWIETGGNPGMATGGMGDVLTGVIAALRAQGLAPLTAALAGVHVHARAGDRAAAQGERGLRATDLIAQLRTLVNP